MTNLVRRLLANLPDGHEDFRGQFPHEPVNES